MTNKRLYALTDEQAKWLGYYAKVGGYPALDEMLTPLDRNAAVERMASAILTAHDRPFITKGEREWYLGDARVAFDTLLQGEG